MSTMLTTLTMIVAAAAGIECVIGRIAAMQWKRHRRSIMLSYLVAAGICLLSASMLWQEMDARWLDLSAWVIAAYLLVTWRAWRNGAPPETLLTYSASRTEAVWQATKDDGRWRDSP